MFSKTIELEAGIDSRGVCIGLGCTAHPAGFSGNDALDWTQTLSSVELFQFGVPLNANHSSFVFADAGSV